MGSQGGVARTETVELRSSSIAPVGGHPSAGFVGTRVGGTTARGQVDGQWIRMVPGFGRSNRVRESGGIERYNREWLLERHGYRTPAEVRRALTRQAA